MVFDEVTIYGHTHKTRRIYFESCYYQVAEDSLDSVLYPDGESPSSDEARQLDERVACFVPYNILHGSDEEIVCYLKKYIYDEDYEQIEANTL